MNRLLMAGLLLAGGLAVQPLQAQPESLVWTSPSHNSSESMPCGGGDVGLNVWVEEGDLLFYVARSGTFDANNTLLKLGRVRVRLTPNPFVEHASSFRQELNLADGNLLISAGGTRIELWVDAFAPLVHLELSSEAPLWARVSYESWRYRDRIIRKGEAQQSSYKWLLPQGLTTRADSIGTEGNTIVFEHRNARETVFDFSVAQQGLDSVKRALYNPLGGLRFGGRLWGDHLIYKGVTDGLYADTDYRAWNLQTDRPRRKLNVTLELTGASAPAAPAGKQATRAWWRSFWQRSFIRVDRGELAEAARNYTLFRYLLGCNARGAWPTKFNGGLFTFDPCYADTAACYTPDYRRWGGGIFTAQNQRLVYWPMLKSGDVDVLQPYLDFYLRLLPNATLRTAVYWHHAGASFTEQLESYGLPNPAEYGGKRPAGFDAGLEYNAWLEYQWDTALECCLMVLDAHTYAGIDLTPYRPLIEGCLTFFDEHYRYLARRRGHKELNEQSQVVLYPGSGCETYKMAYNPSSTLAALHTVYERYYGRPAAHFPPVPLRQTEGRTLIAPAVVWERVNNTETPQLYPVFPWRRFGIWQRDSLEIARNTYLHDPDALRFRSTAGWKQDNVWAACLGLTDEARGLTRGKMASGPYRYPAFWSPGFDWAPDHNRGGVGMIGLQEMLLQTHDAAIYLFPAWNLTDDVHFRLHAPGQTVVEAELKGGRLIRLQVTPEYRRRDILLPPELR